jgi:hypothetical protein
MMASKVDVVEVENMRASLVVGPTPQRGAAFRFMPGRNIVPLDYWEMCLDHPRFKPLILNETIKELDPDEDKPLDSLVSLNVPQAMVKINQEDDPKRLLRWGAIDQRQTVHRQIKERLEALSYTPTEGDIKEASKGLMVEDEGKDKDSPKGK